MSHLLNLEHLRLSKQNARIATVYLDLLPAKYKMLDSLYISNYRNLEELSVDSLGAVNLIIGKNNTGKSSLLEAVGINVTAGDIDFIFQLLEERGENYKQVLNGQVLKAQNLNIKALLSLFTGRGLVIEKRGAVQINADTYRGERQLLSIRFVFFIDEDIYETDKKIHVRRKRIIEEGETKVMTEFRVGLEIANGEDYFIAPLDNINLNVPSFDPASKNDPLQFIRTRNIDREVNAKLWDDIILTEKENYVIDALKIIEPSVERIAFVDDTFGGRSAVIKLKNDTSVLPLRSMGDGINRVLTIILALVNAVDGYLLIDEFENGLHHSVQEKLWEIIFTLSQKLNIQVFATTHSEDCIAGFEEVLSSQSDKKAGKLIRLENKNGKIVEVEFSANELRIATENNIEIR